MEGLYLPTPPMHESALVANRNKCYGQMLRSREARKIHTQALYFPAAIVLALPIGIGWIAAEKEFCC
jgi:hypothetical protein